MILALLAQFPLEVKAQLTVNVSLEEGALVKPVRRGPYGSRPKSGSTQKASSTGIVVWLEMDASTNPKLREPQILDQKDTQFSPRMLVLRSGETMRVLNSDPIYHNVFSLSDTKKFDIGRRRQGEFKDVTMDAAGVVKVFCEIHSHMSAEIVVLNERTHSWQLLKEGQSAVFPDLDSNSYTLHVYAPGFSSHEQRLFFDGSASVLNVNLSR